MNTRATTAGLVLLSAGLFGAAHAQQTVTPSDEVKAQVAETVDGQVVVTPEVQSALNDVMERVKSPQWAAEQSRLKKEIGVLTGNGIVDGPEEEDAPYVAEDRLVIFVSSSMPLTTLRNYAKDLDEINGLMVMRGMIGGMKTMGPTLSHIAKVLRVNPNCTGGNCAMRTTNFVIDPVLFRENGISQVPAAVFVEDMPLEPYCERFEEDSVPPKARYVVYGDVSAKHMAGELFRMSKSKPLERLVKEM